MAVLSRNARENGEGMQGWLTRVVHHNHSTHSHNGFEAVNAPQGISIDAAAGIAVHGGFCGWSVI